jgi:hypothetical protein
MHTEKDQAVSFYEQYLREYHSVLQLLEQTLANRRSNPDCDEQMRLRLLREEVVAAFIHVTERMQSLVLQGLMEVDVVLAALVRECCESLATLEERCAIVDEDEPDPATRRQTLVRPADRLFQDACQRMLKRA